MIYHMNINKRRTIEYTYQELEGETKAAKVDKSTASIEYPVQKLNA